MLVLLDGDRRGQAADVPNLFLWGRDYSVNYPSAVDTSLLFAPIVNPAPCVAIVDARTMTIKKLTTEPLTPGSAALNAFNAVLGELP